MTVGQLIKELQDMSSDLQVLIFPDGESNYRPLELDDINVEEDLWSEEKEIVLFLG